MQDIASKPGRVRLTVVSGPDSGLTLETEEPLITVGRGSGNDFALRDGLVSQRHGEVCIVPGGLVWRDLCSRHGTLVRVSNKTVNLHDRSDPSEVAIEGEAHVIVGETLIRIEENNRTTTTSETTAPESRRILRRTTANLDTATRRLRSQDARFLTLFRLGRDLHQVTELDDVFTRIADVVLEAFPNSNFIALSSPPDPESGEMVATHVRHRVADLDEGSEILSQSLLQQVWDERESVLFVRDDASGDPTESIVNARITACMAAPVVGQHGLLGILQADTRGVGGIYGPDDLDLFTLLASVTALAMERARLNRDLVDMFEGVVNLSVTTIDARDPATAGHSSRVSRYTMALARAVHDEDEGPFANVRFSDDELKELRYASLLHDFGKIGVPESVMMKNRRLDDATLAKVMERLEVARQAARADVLEELCREAAGSPEILVGVPLDEALEERVATRCAPLDEAAAAIQESLPGSWQSDEQLERIRRIASIRVPRSDGTTVPLLEPNELEQLCVRRGTLTETEWEQMRSHALRSEQLLERIPWGRGLERVPIIAGMHHEKLDGSGYPRGLCADQLPPQARIMTICDIYDALTAVDRGYRTEHGHERARQILLDEAKNGLLSAPLVKIFLEQVLPGLPQAIAPKSH